MRSRTKIVLYAGCILAVVAVLFVLLREREPTHDGRPLSYWVAVFGALDTQEGRFEKAEVAVNEIGTNALPFLLKWIQYEPSPWRYKLAKILRRRAPTALLRRIVSSKKREALANGTLMAFDVLGTRATAAIPELTRLMNNPSAPDTAYRAGEALGILGTNALPSLITVINSPKHCCRAEAISALSYMHMRRQLGPYAEALVPHLVSCLSDPNDIDVPLNAARTLGYLKSAPQLAVPALAACLSSTNEALQVESAQALGEFDRAAAAAVPELKIALRSSDFRLSAAASNALLTIAPEVLTNALRR